MYTWAKTMRPRPRSVRTRIERGEYERGLNLYGSENGALHDLGVEKCRKMLLYTPGIKHKTLNKYE